MQTSTHQRADDLQKSLSKAVHHRSPSSPWTVNIRYCVPQLAELLTDSHDEPIDRLAPAVRHILLEHCETDVAGHSDFHELEEATDLLLQELNNIRRLELTRGDRSDCPVPPQMFG